MMKITLVGHGQIEIPPKGYGAVESLIADYADAFGRLGHTVAIINENDSTKTVDLVNASQADLVWLHDDRRAMLAGKFVAPRVAITSHDPLLFSFPNNPLIKYLTRGTHLIGCLSQGHLDGFLAAGVEAGRLFLCPNGARADLIRFSPSVKHSDTLICVGMISGRKGQHLLKEVLNVRFAGDFSSIDPVPDHKALKGERWLGAWTKRQIYQDLTDYEAAILLSSAEAAPLAIPEYLMAGLPCILSRAAAVNLPPVPFVKVLDDWILKNPDLVHIEVDNFIKGKRWDRKEIRRFAEQHFDWQTLTRKVEQQCLQPT